ncbi:MAG TPA: glycosyltransferase [Thermoclostridium sp.]|jgi:teichuronic acid biosynthesis glycosyltransferase TuaG
MMKQLVSIIMPVYNGEKTIEKAIRSVLSQTYENFELIVIDDNSTDDTAKIVNSFLDIDKRIILIKNKENCGVSVSRNIGCKSARGEYIAFLDSDDVWMENKLEKQINLMQEKDCDLAYTAYTIVYSSKRLLKKEILYQVPETVSYEELLKENVIGCSTVLLRAKAMNNHEFDRNYIHEDFVLWLGLAKEGKKFCGLNENLVLYAYGGRSSNKILAAKNRWIIYRRSQKLSFPMALYYMNCYLINALKKYIKLVTL